MSGNITMGSGVTLIGSSSYATTASYTLSSSYAVSSSRAVSSSYAVTASYVISSSYASTSSYTLSSSYARSSSYSSTSSYIGNAIYTASIASTTLTFTKGDGSTFPISLPGGGGGSGATDIIVYPTVPSQIILQSASVNIGNPLTVPFATTSSYITASGIWGPHGSSSVLSASYAVSSSRAISSSYAVSSSYTLSSSYSTTSSYASTASFAPSYVLNSATSSFVQNNQTSSFVLNSQTSSMTVATASYVSSSNVFGPDGFNSIQSSSYSLSSSYAFSSSYALSASRAISSSYAVSSSYAISASYAVSSSYTLSSSYALSASYSISSSYALSSSYAVSASYALSASYAPTAPNIKSGSFGITIDGGGGTLTAGEKGYISMPCNGTFTGWTIASDIAGACNIGVYVSTDSLATSASIAGSEIPSLGGARFARDLNLTTWTPGFSANDIIIFRVLASPVPTATKVSLTINYIKS
jgi:hypothetical protein